MRPFERQIHRPAERMKTNIAKAKKAMGIDDPELVWTFFLAFSRFEYALKRVGYINTRNGNVSANWQRFASVNRRRFDLNRDPELLAAYDYLISRPPKKQASVQGVLSWRDSAPIGKTPVLCWLVQTVAVVRNNLFHGGKFPWPVDTSRNSILIRHSLVLLDAFVELDKRVKHYFTGRG